MGAAWTLIPLARGPLLLIAQQLIGDGCAAITIHEVSLRQSLVEDRYLGRVNAAIRGPRRVADRHAGRRRARRMDRAASYHRDCRVGATALLPMAGLFASAQLATIVKIARVSIWHC